jgi:hypothetical protein
MKKHNFFGTYWYDKQVLTHFYVCGDTHKEVYDNLCEELDCKFLDIPEGLELTEFDYLQFLYFYHKEINTDISFGYSLLIYKLVPGITSSHVEQVSPIER